MSIDIKEVLLAALCACAVPAGTAHAADSTEVWPELNGFVNLSPRTRASLVASYAEGKESDTVSLDVAAYLDVSLKPITRKALLSEDWQRSRYFWARMGYVRVFKATSETQKEVAEDRGVFAIHGKAPLPAEIWLEARVRADLRWIGDEYSERYRLRIEATREFNVRGHSVDPYLNYEWFYDTRYDAWARTLWTAGSEVTLTEHFRFEVFLSGQSDRHPEEESLLALGLVAKWYY